MIEFNLKQTDKIYIKIISLECIWKHNKEVYHVENTIFKSLESLNFVSKYIY